MRSRQRSLTLPWGLQTLAPCNGGGCKVGLGETHSGPSILTDPSIRMHHHTRLGIYRCICQVACRAAKPSSPHKPFCRAIDLGLAMVKLCFIGMFSLSIGALHSANPWSTAALPLVAPVGGFPPRSQPLCEEQCRWTDHQLGAREIR